VSIAVTTILWADWSNRFVWIVLAVTLGFGAVGWVDDYRKVVHRNPKGLSAREKYFWQSLIGLAAAVSLAFAVPASSAGQAWTLFTQWVASGFLMDLPPKADLIVPFFKNVAYPLGVFGFIVLTYFVIVGTSNAVNLTDGLDGLAILPAVMIGGALGIFVYVAGNAVHSKYLLFPYIPARANSRCSAARWSCRARVPLVQRVPGRSVHGRRRCAGARRRARHRRGDRTAGDRALHHGRRVRRRDALGDAAGPLLQGHRRQAHLPHGAAAPPLRARRVEGDPGRGAVLDHHGGPRAVRSLDV